MDPLSLLCRLAMSVAPPRFHTVKYAGVLASASPLRSRIAPVPAAPAALVVAAEHPAPRRSTYRAWAQLLKRTFDFDVLCCPSCGGRMKLLAMVTDEKSIARYPTAICALSQNSGVVLSAFAKRSAVLAVTARRPLTIPFTSWISTLIFLLTPIASASSA
jgi:hypothetical protein